MEQSLSDMGGGLTPKTVGTLNVPTEAINVLHGVRQKHEQLNALMYQVMRKVVLPRCKEIGDDLLAVKSFYPKGKRGSASKFYADAKTLTGLSKPSVANYIQLSENWPRLMDYMVDLPEGATPITSLRGALEAIREMNRPLQPALSEGAMDVDATAVEGGEEHSAAVQRTHYAASARKSFDEQFAGLKATTVLTEKERDYLRRIQEQLQRMLEEIDRREGEAAVPAVVSIRGEEVETEGERAVEPEPEAAGAKSGRKGVLAGLYPKTRAGWEALEADLAAHGSGAKLAAHHGVSKQAVSKYRNSMKEELGVE